MLLNYAVIPPGKNPIELQDVENLCLDNTQVYSNYKNNFHHWTTEYVWNNFIPKLCNELQIDFNSNDFKLINNTDESGKINLNYHIPLNDYNIHYIDYTTNKDIHCKISELRKDCSNNPSVTAYHKLYLGWHKTTEIINLNSKYDRFLLLNTDSESIPVVPILTYYYRKILVLDNRKRYSFRNKIKEYFTDKTDLVRLMVDFNWNLTKMEDNLK